MGKNKFIVIESCDGAGKTTLINKLKKYFEKNENVFFTKEPGDTAFAERVRRLLLEASNHSISPLCEAHLFACARYDKYVNIYNPILNRKHEEPAIIISDRYMLSSLIYQGVGRDLGIDEVKKINDDLFKLEPNDNFKMLTLFLDVHPDTIEKEKRNMNRAFDDRIELEGLKFQRKIYNGYKDNIEKLTNGNYIIIDANKSIEEVFEEVLFAIIRFTIEIK